MAKARLRNLFRPRSGGGGATLGVEAGDSWLRIACYQAGKGQNGWVMAGIDWGAGNADDGSGGKQLLGDQLGDMKLPRVPAVCAINSLAVEIFPLSLKPSETDSLDALVIRQAQKHLGDQLTESVLDYAVLPEEVRRQGDNAIPVLVFAAPEKGVEEHLTRFEKAGVEVSRLLTPACAMAGRVADARSDTRHLLIATSDEATSISVVQNADVLFERILPWGSRKLEERLTAELDLEGGQGHVLLASEEGTALSRANGEGGGVATLERVGGAVGQVLEPEFEMLGREALGCLRFCDTYYRHVTASSAVLAGSLAGNEPLRRSLEENLSISFRAADEGLSIPGYSSGGQSPEYATAACCALWKEKAP